MIENNMFVKMIARASDAGLRFMTILLILLTLTVIVFVGSIWYMYVNTFMDSGAKTECSTKPPVSHCQPLDARAKQLLTTGRPNDYLICLKKETKK